jgi:hypothetical protein
MDRMWFEATLRWRVLVDARTCSTWTSGDDRGALGVDARRDEILERQEAHPRWGQG